MAFGKKRRARKRKAKGWVGLKDREAKRANLLAEHQRGLEAFAISHPVFAESLNEIRLRAAEGYQIPKTDYDVSDHLREIFELVLEAGKTRKGILQELDAIYARKTGSNRYLSLLKAASVPNYNEKQLSKSAQRVRGAITEKIKLDDFEEYRKTFEKSESRSGRKK